MEAITRCRLAQLPRMVARSNPAQSSGSGFLQHRSAMRHETLFCLQQSRLGARVARSAMGSNAHFGNGRDVDAVVLRWIDRSRIDYRGLLRRRAVSAQGWLRAGRARSFVGAAPLDSSAVAAGQL